MTAPSLVTHRRGLWHARTTTYIVLTLLGLFALGPLVIFAFNALKSQAELGANPLGVPTDPRWHNFVQAFLQANMGAGLVNSLFIVGGTVLGVCFIAGCAAYAMARLALPGGGAVMLYLLVGSALPIQLFLVPLFYLWTRAGLYDTRFGLVIIYCAIFSPFATLLLRSFMLGLPQAYEDAARIDGAGEWKVLTRITLRLSWPGFLTIALVTALAAYNEFLLAVTFIQTAGKMPVSTTFFAFQQGYTQNYTLISAAGLIMVIPMLALFLGLQRRFVEGVTASGLGG
jgi:raffinose/stachyose/melibiose transport system permease protein